MQFTDRFHAGRMLARALEIYKHHRGLVLGVPRGGVPVGYEIARKLSWPLEIVLCKKIGHPLNKEYAIGATGITEHLVNYEEGVDEAFVQQEIIRVQNRLQDMLVNYLGHRKLSLVTGRTVIIADDGIATGNTLRMTIRLLRQQHPERIIVAAPVASESAYHALANEADNVIVLHHTNDFVGVGQFYEEFQQTNDDEVKSLLDQNLHEIPH